MENSQHTKILKLFLRLSLSAGFLSAVADRFGWWSKEVSVWGNWESFLAYTELINPWMPKPLMPAIGLIATGAEILFALFLIIGFKTELFARLSGFLLLLFALAMTFSIGIKAALDYFRISCISSGICLMFDKGKIFGSRQFNFKL